MNQEERIGLLEREVSEVKIRMAVAESNIKEMRVQLTKIDSNTSWTVRLVIGAIIIGVLNVVLNGVPL